MLVHYLFPFKVEIENAPYLELSLLIVLEEEKSGIFYVVKERFFFFFKSQILIWEGGYCENVAINWNSCLSLGICWKQMLILWTGDDSQCFILNTNYFGGLGKYRIKKMNSKFFSSADLLQVSNLRLKNIHTLNNHDAVGTQLGGWQELKSLYNI